MVTSDGYVKILDFGLAKLLPQPGVDSEAATITKEGTVPGGDGDGQLHVSGASLGKASGCRTDVFSLGRGALRDGYGQQAIPGGNDGRAFRRDPA